MKTRSRRGNILNDDRESDSEDSIYTSSSSKRRKKIPSKLSNHLPKYRRTLNIELRRSEYSEKNHMPIGLRRKIPDSMKVEQNADSLQSLPPHSGTDQVYVNGDGNVDEKQNVRRSTRQRKFTYDNLNQTWLLASNIPDFSKLEPLFSSEQTAPRDGRCGTEQPRRSERNRNHELRRLGMSPTSLDFDDMYSRVKRERRKSVHSFYSRRMPQDVGSMADTEDTDHNISDSDSVDEASDLEEGIGGERNQQLDVSHSPKYSLRPKKPITERFQFPIEPTRPRRSNTNSLFDVSSHHQRARERDPFKSPAHKSPLFRRKRHAIHNSSSTSSSSDDERRFEKRKARSMARARNRCLPLNFMDKDLANGVLRDRTKIGSSLADIDPMAIDKTVTFDNVGGLDRHIQSLKEMILFPLMYPEVFERFKISPPRGVLFHGQPGTGKTLVARALANECSQGDRRVAFFMRKGADCLSKWVGESERQLRLLFDQAYTMRPAIIFFDEIDGLAPVRSSRQDQIHSSIVSTLLALMDGLDSRGEIVVIGATNRIDAIDPALRRPGRFDRELIFPLPSLQARQKILKINVKHWNPPLADDFILELATQSAGYCGADLKALCSEAALVALRRCYPQIYASRQKLQLDINTIQITSQDFISAMKKIKPTVQRSSVYSPSSLSQTLKPLLERMLRNAIAKLQKVFPVTCQLSKREKGNCANTCEMPYASNNTAWEDSGSSAYEDEEGNGTCDTQEGKDSLLCWDLEKPPRSSRFLWPFVHRPRFLLSGSKGQGQGSIAPAILYILENVPVHRLDIPALYAVTSRAPEEACAHIFYEAQRNLPSIIFLPHVGYWWETLSDTVRATFLSLLQDLEPCTPVMLLATSDRPFLQLPSEVQEIFSVSTGQVMHMDNPNEEERKTFFTILLKEIFIPPRRKKRKEYKELLPVALLPEPRRLTSVELEKLRLKEEATLRELRLFLRDILTKLARDRRFSVFTRPVDPEEVPDYQDVIKSPMDLETMMSKIDLHQYETVAEFLADVDLICHNALEYNPDRDPSDKLIRHRACALKDTAHALVNCELDNEFEKICRDIQLARKERGESPSKFAPKGFHVLPRVQTQVPQCKFTDVERSMKSYNCEEGFGSMNTDEKQITPESPTRYSKRIRGIGVVPPTTADFSNAKTETFVPPKRTARYMIWRRRKSPWFGACRRKLVRRRVDCTKDISLKKTVKCNNEMKNPSPTPLSPIPEASSSREYKMQQLAAIDKMNSVSDTFMKSTFDSTSNESSNFPASSEFAVDSKTVDENVNCVPGIVFVTDTEENAVVQDTDLSTSLCNTSLNCDVSIRERDCSRTPSVTDLVVDPSPVSPGIQDNTKDGVENLHAPGNNSVTEIEIQESRCISDPKPCASRPKIIIDADVLSTLLDHIVNVTAGCSVDILQRLFTMLQQCICSHREELNKQNLLMDLKKEIKQFCSHPTS